MIRLMNDSGVLKEKIDSLDGITFDQMIAAVHAVQTDLKITGTTANEAEKTIEGSLNSTKAAWANLLTGMGDDTQDFNKLLDDFIGSASNFVKNVTPRIKMIFDAIPEAIKGIAPQIPGLLNAILPGLISAAVTLVASLAAQLPSILGTLKNALFAALDAIVAAVGEKAPGLAAPLKLAFDGIKGAIDLLTTHFDKIVIAVGAAATAFGAFQLLSFIGQAGSVAAAVAKMTTAITAGTVAKIADKAETLALQALYAKDAVLKGAATVKTIALTAAQKAAAVAQRALNLVMNANPMGIIITVIALLVTAFITLWHTNEDFRKAVIKIWDAVKQKATSIFGAIGTFIKKTWDTIKKVTSTVWNAIKKAVSTAVKGVQTVIKTVFGAIKKVIQLEVNGWKKIITTVWNAIKKVTTTVLNAIKKTVTTVFNAIKKTTTTVWNAVKTTVSKAVSGIKTAVSNGFNGLKGTVSKVWSGIKTAITNPINSAKTAVSNAIGKIKSIINGAHLSLPHFKLPHFKINGGKLPWGIGGKGTPPKVSVDWYAKGAVFSRPTLIPNVRGTAGVGEAGPEAVAPIDVLQGYVRQAVAEQNAGMVDQLQAVYNLLAQYLPEIGHGQVVMDTGALVGQIAPSMDRRLGRIYKNQERGRG